ncbi:transglycosylase SLT domain-containing protein [Acidisoma sp.]|uniref:transglycosylase SLT domain-containing protein n=1 Tax=Acidisoma sp. TaxID=1872115 RepID=UPI003B005BBE
MPRHAPPIVTARSLAAPGIRSLRLAASLALIGLLAACSAHTPRLSATQQAMEYKDNASGDYRPPGPPDDPWGPYVVEASQRFDVPQSWIRNVMHTESGGQLYINGQLVTSPVGAMGLMQLMPQTYQELEGEYGLGDDPYSPHDNIMAGAAYLREMYDLFGSPGFLAAYNAGPQRLNEYLTDGRPLPDETTHYVAMIQPYIQGDMPQGRSPADQFAMNSMSAPSSRPYNGGASASLAETGGGLVSSGSSDGSLAETGGGLVSGGDAHGGGAAAVVAMNEAANLAPAGTATDPGDSGADALNTQQVAVHSAQLVADGGGAVPADLMAATDDPRPTPAQVEQEEAAANAGDSNQAPVQQQAAYQPAVIEQTPATPAAPTPAVTLPAARPVFQVAPSYQPSYSHAAPVPAGAHLAQNYLPPPPPAAPAVVASYSPQETRRNYGPAPTVGPGGMENLAMEADAPQSSYHPRARGGLHFISPAEAETMPLYSTSHIGGWAIQVGAYGNAGDARAAVESARRHEHYELASARTIVMPVHVSQRLLYRARLSGLSESAAVNACEDIRGRSPCMVLSPDAISD